VLGNLALGRPMEESLKALAETTKTFLMDNLIPSVTNIFGAMPGAISTLWRELMPGNFSDLASEAISSFTSFVTENVDSVLDSGGELLYSLIDGIIAVIPELTEAAVEIVGALGEYLTENQDEMLAAAGELGKKAAQAIWDSLVIMWESLSANPLAFKVSVMGQKFGESMNGGMTSSSHAGLGGSFAKGLDYVPYDGFIAELHQGEMILTRAQANAVRNGRIGAGVTVNQYFYDSHHTAADQMAAARYEQEKAVLGLV
jgi:hypothetical protein